MKAKKTLKAAESSGGEADGSTAPEENPEIEKKWPGMIAITGAAIFVGVGAAGGAYFFAPPRPAASELASLEGASGHQNDERKSPDSSQHKKPQKKKAAMARLAAPVNRKKQFTRAHKFCIRMTALTMSWTRLFSQSIPLVSHNISKLHWLLKRPVKTPIGFCNEHSRSRIFLIHICALLELRNLKTLQPCRGCVLRYPGELALLRRAYT